MRAIVKVIGKWIKQASNSLMECLVANALLVQTLLTWVVFLLALLSLALFRFGEESNSGGLTQALSWLCLLSFSLHLAVQTRSTGSLLSPLPVFSMMLFVFSCGQVLLKAFGVWISGFDIFRQIAPPNLNYALLFTTLGLSLYFLGAQLSINPAPLFETRTAAREESPDSGLLFKWGLVFFAIGILPYLYFLVHNLLSILEHGYRAYYSDDADRVNNYIMLFGYLVFPGIALVSAGGSRGWKLGMILVLVAFSVLRIISGDRGSSYTMIIASLIMYRQYFFQKTVRWYVYAALSALMLLATPLVGVLRHGLPEGAGFFGEVSNILVNKNPVIATLTNLGGTLYPLGRTMELVPSAYSHTRGMTYVASAINVLPDFVHVSILGEISGNLKFASPGKWLQNALEITWGPGFTPFAEAFLNFSWYGVLFMLPFGWLLGKAMHFGARRERDRQLAKAMSITAFIGLAFGARGSSNEMLAFGVRYILFPYGLIKASQIWRTKVRKSRDKDQLAQ